MVMISRKMLSIQPTAGDNSEMSDIDIHSNGNIGFMPNLWLDITICTVVCKLFAGVPDLKIQVQRSHGFFSEVP
jgi:hypothetical protein